MILDSLILQSKLFFTEDMGIEIDDIAREEDSVDLNLKSHTAMIGVGGELNMMVVISFDDTMLDKLVEVFMEGEDVASEEEEEIKESVTGEVINTIIGLALPTFPKRGKGVTITPPISINDASNIKKHKDSKIVSANIRTHFGELSMSAIIAKDASK
ncbi:MAG: chemotaxis protein CheX [Campylobacterales bacterium]|nr:chemotaxis protein CheX [Campylobacterales bacterium]